MFWFYYYMCFYFAPIAKQQRMHKRYTTCFPSLSDSFLGMSRRYVLCPRYLGIDLKNVCFHHQADIAWLLKGFTILLSWTTSTYKSIPTRSTWTSLHNAKTSFGRIRNRSHDLTCICIFIPRILSNILLVYRRGHTKLCILTFETILLTCDYATRVHQVSDESIEWGT